MLKSLILFSAATVSAMYETASSRVIKLTAADFQKKVVNSKEPWLIEFYAPWCGHCQQLEPSWEKAARILEGVVKVGAVDADQEKQLGSQYGVTGFPTIKMFGLSSKKQPLAYQGGRDADSIVKYAMDQTSQDIRGRLGGKSSGSSSSNNSGNKGSAGKASGSKDEVVVLTANNFDRLVLGSKHIWMVEFYAPWCGHCQALEPEYAQAAKNLKGQVRLGKVDATVEKDLAARFGVQGYPTVKVFDYGEGKTDSKAYDYPGERTASAITNFGSDLAEKADIVPDNHQLIRQVVYDNNCKGSVICVITFLPNIYDSSANERNAYLQNLETVMKKNRKQPFRYFWLQAGDQLDLERQLSLGFGFPAVIAVSPLKKMMSTMRMSFSESNINQFLSDILVGRERLQTLPGEIKINKADKWDGKDAPPMETLEDEYGEYGDEPEEGQKDDL